MYWFFYYLSLNSFNTRKFFYGWVDISALEDFAILIFLLYGYQLNQLASKKYNMSDFPSIFY